jgi:hypothetical protein
MTIVVRIKARIRIGIKTARTANPLSKPATINPPSITPFGLCLILGQTRSVFGLDFVGWKSYWSCSWNLL